MRIFLGTILGILLVAVLPAAGAQKLPKALSAPSVHPAIDGILDAFATHPLVALGNSEGNAQQEDFYAALVRDPRFAREVGNVVVEFWAGAHQDILDRYLNGEDVPFTDLRKVWSDLVGYNFPADMGLVNFFVTVREVNRKLPPDQRIHVWGGEPPIDWSKITRGFSPPPPRGTQSPLTEADFNFWIGQRASYPAGIIEGKILAYNKKALVIYGAGHFYGEDSLIRQVEAKHPNSVFKVQMYYGFAAKSCSESFEKIVRKWPTPALAMPIKGTSLADSLYTPRCDVVPITSWQFEPATTDAEKSRMISGVERMISGANADALLFLGKSATLTQSPFEPSIYLDADYRQEMNRHAELGQDMEWPGAMLTGRAPLTDSLVRLNPTSPRYIHPY
jgi:hypothetical protein